MRIIDLASLADTTTVLRNPHKGWYHHYFDNAISKYLPATDAEIETFPGMDHIYLRLAWSYLEPRQGQFNWAVVDDVIDKWVAKGMAISFRISCKESDDCAFATPEWVKDAGAKGEMVTWLGKEPTSWRPDYADPIFLKYLEDFHRTFAARYDAKPWLRYVDIGSYGQWGEGHNWGCGLTEDEWPVETLQEHVRIHQRYYRNAVLVVPDEFAIQRTDGRGPELFQWLMNEGVTLRDDSIGVGFHVKNFPADSLSHPEVWEDAWRKRPTIVELQHYPMMRNPKQDNTWRGRNGSEFGAKYLLGAIHKIKPTYIGYHGDAPVWLADNPELTNELANKVGYWFFLQSLALPERIRAGQSMPLCLAWLNRGIAPAYRRFTLTLRWRDFSTGAIAKSEILSDSDCRQWMPDMPVNEGFNITAPAAGRYGLELALLDQTAGPERRVLLAVKREAQTPDGFCRVAEVEVG